MLEEAQESYEGDGVVVPMRSDTADEMDANVEAIRAWHAQRTAGAAAAAAAAGA